MQPDHSKRGLALTFFGPGCWMWQTNDADGEIEHEGVAGSREQAIEDARNAVASDEGGES